MPDFSFNPITGKLDLIWSQEELDDLYLKLNQTTPQEVINGSPKFQKGLTIKSGEKLIFDGD